MFQRFTKKMDVRKSGAASDAIDQPSPGQGKKDRRGIVLILSLGMLTLFTIVAITLASISRTQSTAAANFKRAEQYGRGQAGLRPEQVSDLFQYAVNQLIYDTRNPQSAIRGHSLLRDMYGSPETYEIETDASGFPFLEEVEGNGAELRLRKSDLKRLLSLADNPTTDRDPRVTYQGVYNGTGLPLPTKKEVLWLTGGTPQPPTILDLRLTNREIALQMAFPHMPLSVVPFGKTNVPIGGSALFAALQADHLSTTLPATVSAWFPRFSLNYAVIDPIGRRAATSTYPDGSTIAPEKFFYFAPSRVAAASGPIRGDQAGFHWFGADEDYDYPDVNNMFLAMERADGRILIPSFHRPGIVAQTAAGIVPLAAADGATAASSVPAAISSPGPASRLSNVGQIPWLTSQELDLLSLPRDVRQLVLRTRASDVDPATVLGISNARAGRFREMADSFAKSGTTLVPGQDGLPDDLDGSGFVGDHPSELDVDTDGDGLNDAVWIDLGYKPIQVGDAVLKPLFAFKVLDLDGKLNLNVHGNMQRPAAMAGATINRPNTPGQHSSHLGASVTEINPLHGIIVGDTPADVTSLSNLTEPVRPVWLFDRTVKSLPDVASVPLTMLDASYPHPYQRLLEGFTDAAGNYHPGRWSSPTGDPTVPPLPGLALLDDNFNFNPLTRTSLDFMATQTVAQQQAMRTLSTLHSVGNGVEVMANNEAAVAQGIPAVSSPQSPADMVGTGRNLSPFSRRGLRFSRPTGSGGFSPALKNLENPTADVTPLTSGLLHDEGNLLPLFVNHSVTVSPSSQVDMSKYKNPNDLMPWGVYTSFQYVPNSTLNQIGTGSLVPEMMTFDEALEINPHNPLQNDDYFFSAADMAALWRAGDIDGPSSTSRLSNLWPSQVVPRTVDISATSASVTPPAYTREAYAKKRQQRMFTHASWDLNRFNSTPGLGLASLGRHFGGSVPEGVTDFVETFMRSSRRPQVTDSNFEVLNQLLRKHSGSMPSILSNQMVGLLPGVGTPLLPKAPTLPGESTLFPGTSNNGRVALEQLAIRRTVDGKDFLIPYEVQMGRRFDLNRPMSAYSRVPTATYPTMLNVAGAGAKSPDQVDLEREALAQQIYVLLSIAAGQFGDTGVPDTNTIAHVKMRIAQGRALAQLAVNIVDYMDPDSVMTRMEFDPYLADGWELVDYLDPITSVPVAKIAKPPIDLNGSVFPSTGADITSKEWKATCTVIGFELPEVVINEAVSVVREDIVKVPGPPGMPDTEQRNEILLTWVELFNPWPGTLDPVQPLDTTTPDDPKPVRGVRLFDPTTNQPRFMLGIDSASKESKITPLAATSKGSTEETALHRRFVRFDGTEDGSSGEGSPHGSNRREPVVFSRDESFRADRIDLSATNSLYGDYGYFVVGPTKPTGISAETLGRLKGIAPELGWDPTSASTLFPSLDYAASACAQVFRENAVVTASEAPVVNVKLYRLRNPFADFNPEMNPYVAVDTIELRGSSRPTHAPYHERNSKTGDLGSEQAPTDSEPAGVYYAWDSAKYPDPTTAIVPAWADVVSPRQQGGSTPARKTWQRRQPWHGWNGEWNPYADLGDPARKPDAAHPLVGNLGTQPQRNLEGAFLGLPSLAEPSPSAAGTPPLVGNGMRQNGFIRLGPSFARGAAGARSPRETLNTASGGLDRLERWQTIPFANRQLATPLELLNVRMYGSHLWRAGLDKDNKTVFEWRLRFTDDFEFFSHAYKSPSTAPNPFFERVWRSRQVPWFTSDRVSHPTWSTTTEFGNGKLRLPGPTYLPNSLGVPGAGALDVQTHLQMPLGNLYRFFEMVECRSPLNNGYAPGQQYYLDDLLPDIDRSTAPLETVFTVNPALKSAPAYAPLDLASSTARGKVTLSRREDRVAGKINLNTITEEEVLKGLIDSVSMMYFNPAEYVQMVTNYYKVSSARGPSNAELGAPGGSAITRNFWPVGYWEGLFTAFGPYPLNDPTTGDTLDMMADIVPWAGPVTATQGIPGLTFARTASNAFVTPPGAPVPTALRACLEGGVELLAYQDFFGASPAVVTEVSMSNTPHPLIVAVNRQFPGVITGPITAGPFAGAYPGTLPDSQVSSEMYRAFLLSRAGADGITGTADDRPFRSFAAMDVEDTILRSRNVQTTGILEPATVTVDAAGALVAEYSEGDLAAARTWLDGVDDISQDQFVRDNTGIGEVSGTTSFHLCLGTTNVRLAGQVLPRLFDPVSNPYVDLFVPSPSDSTDMATDFLLALGADPEVPDLNVSNANAKFKYQRPEIDKSSPSTGLPKTLPVDYWTLDEKRNSLLAKIGGNTTTRSHVFAVWVTVGFFRVEPGTENLKVPLLGAEVGSETGRTKRHRAFFVIDRSQATEYEPEDIDAYFDLERLRNRNIIEYYKVIE